MPRRGATRADNLVNTSALSAVGDLRKQEGHGERSSLFSVKEFGPHIPDHVPVVSGDESFPTSNPHSFSQQASPSSAVLYLVLSVPVPVVGLSYRQSRIAGSIKASHSTWRQGKRKGRRRLQTKVDDISGRS
jgi:hypothetical protein